MRRKLLALALACASASSDGRSYDIEDLLSTESYGQVMAAPDAGLLLAEKRRPYRLATDFGFGGYFNDRGLGHVMATSLARPGEGLRPLFPQEESAGYWMGTLSPSGRLLTVFRLQARTLALGIVDLRTRAVRWLDAAPDLPANAPAPAWIDEARLLVAERGDGRLPRILSLGSAGSDRLGRLNRKQSLGAGSFTVASTVESGGQTTGRLSEIRVDGSGRRTILEGDVHDVALSPDGRNVAVVAAEGQLTPPPPPNLGVSFQSRRLVTRVVSVSDASVLARIEDVAPNVLEWSHSGVLVVIARSTGELGWSNAGILTIDTVGRIRGQGNPSDRPDVAGGGLDLTWTGRTILARVRHGEGSPHWRKLGPSSSIRIAVPTSAVLSVRDGRTAVLSNGGVSWVVTAGRTNVLRRGEGPISGYSLEPFSSTRRDMAGPCGRVVLETVPARPGRRSCGGGAFPSADDDVVAAYRGGLVVRRKSASGAQSLVSLDPRGSEIIVDRINGWLDEVEQPRLRRLQTIDPTGRRLSHWLLLPPRGEAPFDLVVQPYPGRSFGVRPPGEARPERHSLGTNPLLLVGAGMAVLLPSMPRTPGHHPVADVVPQVETAVEAARSTGLVRRDRYGVMGHSFGGWAAMVLATGADCLAGVVAANGVYDLTAAHATMAGPDRIDLPLGVPYGPSAGWAEAGQGALTVPPWRAEASYRDASPLLRPDRGSAEVLLIGADLDPVDLGQTERMFMELGRSGRRAELMRFWGEGHTLSSPDNLRAYWSAASSFLQAAATRARTQAPCAASTRHQPSAPSSPRAAQADAHASQEATNMSER